MKQMPLQFLKGMLIASLSLVMSFVSVQAISQEATDSSERRQPPALVELLRTVAASWDSDRKGALLAVDPSRAVPEPDAAMESIASANLPNQSLTQAVQQFGRQAVVFGQVTVLAPTKMIVLNPSPAAPDIYSALSPAEKMRLLLTSLSPSQWQQISSPHGLGFTDLSADLGRLFLSILPDPLQIDTATVQEDYAYATKEAKTLTSDERSQVRLRLNLVTGIQPVPLHVGEGVLLFGGPAMHSPGTSFPVFAPVFEKASSASSYGVDLRSEAPNQVKKGQLNFDLPALAAGVSLQPNTLAVSSELTVGEFVHRAGLAAHLELYADRRVASLPVWLRGNSVPARDLLRALCLGVTGTFRRVGPAYILTDDIEGIGTRQTRIVDWLKDADAQRDTLMDTVRSVNLSQALFSSLSLPPDDPLAQSPAITNEIIQQYGVSYSGAGYETPLASLSAAGRSIVSRYLQGALQQNQPVRSDRAFLDLKLRVTYSVPGVGDVPDEQLDMGSLAGFVQVPPGDETEEPSADSDKVNIQNCAFYVTLSDPEKAAGIVSAAKSAGITQLWVRVTLGGDLSLLKAAIAAGKKAGLPVFAGVSLLGLPSRSPNADLNILGETAAGYKANREVSPTGQRTPGSLPSPMDIRCSDWAQPVSL